MLRERLEPLMLESIRQSKYTNNDGTRLLVRSRDLEDEPFKYQIEYIQAALSMEKKLVVMLYDDGHLDMHNIAIERCFRHIAIGRRNWLHTGSHQAAKNIAFMFGLLETCKLNEIDFGIYIEDVLTRIMYGEHVDDTFLPCGYVPRYKEGRMPHSIKKQ